MRKNIIILGFLISFNVFADGNYGCVTEKAAGLVWEKNQWKTTSFTGENALITIKSNKLIFKYASDQLSFDYSCTNLK